MTRAIPSPPQPQQDQSRMAMHLLTLARWLAEKAVKTEWRAQGRTVKYIEVRELRKASKALMALRRNKLMKEAWEHPYTKQLRKQQRMSLARKAVIAEIRDKGRKVNSIAPDELGKLIEAYLEAHPEVNAHLRELGCF